MMTELTSDDKDDLAVLDTSPLREAVAEPEVVLLTVAVVDDGPLPEALTLLAIDMLPDCVPVEDAAKDDETS